MARPVKAAQTLTDVLCWPCWPTLMLPRSCSIRFPAASTKQNRQLAMFFACGSDRDLDILAEGGEKIHQPLHGINPRLPAHEQRNIRLLDTQNFSGFCLRQLSVFNNPIDL